MAGKSYAKRVRAHKLTLHAMWQLLFPQLMDYFEEKDRDLKEELLNTARPDGLQDYDALATSLASTRFRNCMAEFVQSKDENVNFQYWWQYMNMVCILLLFIRAQRDCLWELHLYAFQSANASIVLSL